MAFFTVTRIGGERSSPANSGFSIENFGKISSGSIKFRPLTVISGLNNSGKSYLAYLYWAVYNFDGEISNSHIGEISAPDWFKEILADARKQSCGKTFQIDRKRLNNHLNRWIGQKKQKIAQSILNMDSADIGSLKITLGNDVYLSRHDRIPKDFTSFKQPFEGWLLSDSEKELEKIEVASAKSPQFGYIGEMETEDVLYRHILKCCIFGVKPLGKATYIPASRSGLILSHKYISSSLISGLRYQGAAVSSDFTAPVIDFLRTLILHSGRRRKGASGATFATAIEEGILKGALTRSDDPNSQQFFYEPTESGVKLPLYAASSMVTEMSSIVEILRSNADSMPIILEEPEAHLHLSAQLEMAKLLIRLSNKGVPVVITTHSDTFLQQINLLIAINESEDRQHYLEKFTYQDDETIPANAVGAYELEASGKMSEIVQTPVSHFGFAVDSVNEVLARLSDQIVEVE